LRRGIVRAASGDMITGMTACPLIPVLWPLMPG
jgi:hypothetical protein